jgi:two-component system copper resistance phosphate regulon response regulator CusR
MKGLLIEGSSSIYRVADVEIDPVRRRVVRAGRELHLTPNEFALLWLLVRYAGEVVSRTIIAEEVWETRFHADTNVIDVTVRRLRRKIDEGFARKLIHTVRRGGYVLRE